MAVDFYLRLYHCVSDMNELKFYINDKLIETLNYGSFTKYYPSNFGEFNVKVYSINNSTTPVFETDINMAVEDIFTFALVGLSSDLGFDMLSSDDVTVNKDKSIIKLVNYSPYDTDFKITINDKPINETLKYLQFSDYYSLKPNKYSLKIYDAITDKLLMTDPNMTLKAGKIYTIYATGYIGVDTNVKARPLQVVIALDGATYL